MKSRARLVGEQFARHDLRQAHLDQLVRGRSHRESHVGHERAADGDLLDAVIPLGPRRYIRPRAPDLVRGGNGFDAVLVPAPTCFLWGIYLYKDPACPRAGRLVSPDRAHPRSWRAAARTRRRGRPLPPPSTPVKQRQDHTELPYRYRSAPRRGEPDPAPERRRCAPYLSPGSVTHREQEQPVIRRYDAQRPGAGDDFGPSGSSSQVAGRGNRPRSL